MLIKNAEIGGELFDIRFGPKIESVHPTPLGDDGAEYPDPRDKPSVVVNMHGCALLPGLHDHHMHYFAASAVRSSVDCHAAKVKNKAALQLTLQQLPGEGWIRGVNYHESIAGSLDRFAIDKFVSDRPVRIQHSSGKFWMLNSFACVLLDLENLHHDGVERKRDGEVSGRIFRLDAWLRTALQSENTDVDLSLAEEMLSCGITSFTDASFTNAEHDRRGFRQLPQSVYMMGDKTLQTGHYKIMLDEERLPDLDELVLDIKAAHERNRPVAFHCVSRIELLIAINALEQSGCHEHDRIEHGAMIPADILSCLQSMGLLVVTQPGFLADRGERFRGALTPEELPDLYRYRSLIDAGVKVVASSDAPYGPLDPWQVIHAGSRRLTEGGIVLGGRECVSVHDVLHGYLTHPLNPAGPQRRISEGEDATFILLNSPLDRALRNPMDVKVDATYIGGELVYQRGASASFDKPSSA